jgi:hypothetical protein
MSTLADEKRQGLQECLEEIVGNAKKYTHLTQHDARLSLFGEE